MKIYLAALYSRRADMEHRADILKACGFEICARWVYGGEEGLTREQIALLDLEDVDACDTLLLFTEPYGSFNRGGGRHAEFGYALAKGKKVVVIGDREHVFCHHPDVEVYPTLELWVASLEVNADDSD